MIKFREHRGNLEESIKTLKKFKNKDELIDFLRKQFKVDKVKSSPYFLHYDCRIDWKETHIVRVETGGILGFTDKPIIEPKPTEMDNWIKELENEADRSISNNVKGTLLGYDPQWFHIIHCTSLKAYQMYH